MSGGLNTQLSFHHQNLFCILKILKSLEQDVLLSARVEQKIPGDSTKQEVDLVLELKDGDQVVKEFYEVKSGVSFTEDVREIKKTLKKLAYAYEKGYLDRAYVISDVNFKKNIIRFEEAIKTVSDGGLRSRKLSEFMSEMAFPENKRQKIYEFCGKIDFEYKEKLESFGYELEIFIKNLRESACPNADHGLRTDDLTSRLICNLYICLERSDGKVSLGKISEITTDWVARNIIASRLADENGDRKALFSDCWDEALAKVTGSICKSFQPENKPGIYSRSLTAEG